MALADHQASGDKAMAYIVAVIALAFAAHVARASLEGLNPTTYLVPGHFHGWAGLLGLLLMTTLWRMGRKTRDLKSEGKPFARSKELHGRISDVMVMLVAIHHISSQAARFASMSPSVTTRSTLVPASSA